MLGCSWAGRSDGARCGRCYTFAARDRSTDVVDYSDRAVTNNFDICHYALGMWKIFIIFPMVKAALLGGDILELVITDRHIGQDSLAPDGSDAIIVRGIT